VSGFFPPSHKARTEEREMMDNKCGMATYSHRKLVIGKQCRHQGKKVIVVFAQFDRQHGKRA
jgi:hypothetical protein